VLLGRKRDIEKFLIWIDISNNRRLLDLKSRGFQRILQNEMEPIHSLAVQRNLSMKFHPYAAKVQLSGQQSDLDEIEKEIIFRLDKVREQVEWKNIDPDVFLWIVKSENMNVRSHLEKKYQVLLFGICNSGPYENSPIIGILGAKNGFQLFGFCEELHWYAVGNIVEKKFLLEDLKKVGAAAANGSITWKFDFNHQKNNDKEDKNDVSDEDDGSNESNESNESDRSDEDEDEDDGTVILRARAQRIKELQAKIQEEKKKENKSLYPKHWDMKTSSEIITISLKETSEEYKTIAGMFMRTMNEAKVKRIERIQNQNLLDNFIEEYQRLEGQNKSKMWMFYGSGEVDPVQIYMDCDIGFDFQLSNLKEKKGFSFVCDAKDAHEMHGYKVKGDLYKMLIVDVLIVGGSKSWNGIQCIIDKSSRCCPLYIIEYEKN